MQTMTRAIKQTHWLAGAIALLVTVGLFTTQLALAQHYAQAATGRTEILLASQKAASRSVTPAPAVRATPRKA